MKPKLAFVTCVIVCVTLIGLSAGCSSNDVSFASIRGDLSPELAGAADRPDDIKRHTAVMSDMNTRSFWDDMTRLWYMDHPSRLSPYPIISPSGNPR